MSSPKRVLVVSRSTTAHPEFGGMEVVLDDIVNRLSCKSLEFSILTTPGFDSKKLRERYGRVWCVKGSRSGKYSLRWWLGTASLKGDWNAWNPDVVLSVSSGASSFVLRSSRKRLPILAQCHGTAWHEVKSSIQSPSPRELFKVPLNLTRVLRERFAYHRFTQTISIGDNVTQQLLASPLRLPSTKIKTIPNSVDAKYWQYSAADRQHVRDRFALDSNVKLAIFVGRLHVQKGADIAISALAQECLAGWHLLLCGTGPEFDNLKRLASQLGVYDRVHFTGFVERQDIPSLLSASDLMVFPTRRKEGLPMNILEGLASGMPVLTSSNASLPSDIGRFVHVSTLDLMQLAQAWKNVSTSASRSSRLPERYTSAVSSVSYYESIHSICAGRS